MTNILNQNVRIEIVKILKEKRKQITFTLANQTISDLKNEAKKLKISASLLVDLTLKEYFELPELNEKVESPTLQAEDSTDALQQHG